MRDPSFAQTLDYRIAVGRFEFALEASERLPDDDRELLLREVAKQILQRLPAKATFRASTPIPVSDAVSDFSDSSLPRPLAPSLAPSGFSPSFDSSFGPNDKASPAG